MNVTAVKTPKERAAFIELPYQFYRNDPMWVEPLRSEQKALFDEERNPFLQHCKHQLFLLMDGEKTVGRVAALVDTLANDYWGQPVGLFGHYECPDDPAASRLLLDSARGWLLEQGMPSMRGPWSFTSQEWGAVVEGFSPEPVVMAPYNPPYYNDHFLAYGMQKTKDLLVYLIDVRKGYQIPNRILELTDKVAERYKVHVRPMEMKNLEREIEIINELSNASLEHNWGYAPVTDAEVRGMVHDLKQIVNPKAVLFAEDENNRPIGFAICIPDINQIIKGMRGRLLPFGWIRLLWKLPRLKRYRMFALGMLPEYHGKGVDSLLYRALYERMCTPDLVLEINYVLEDNGPMNNAILKLGAEPMRRYRIYETPIQ